MSSGETSSVLQGVRFAGTSSGLIKGLGAFKKGHHSVPDAVNGATTAFLAKLVAEDLAEEGEKYFQRARALFDYKRKQLALEVGAGLSVLSSKDFQFEILYSLSGDNPAEYTVFRTLREVRRADFLVLPACDEMFEGIFSEVIFSLSKGAPVEQVIDAIENLDAMESILKVSYPSDYADCIITVPAVNAHVRFSGPELAMVFPRKGTPKDLWEGFLAVREAFSLTDDKTLRGLVGARRK